MNDEFHQALSRAMNREYANLGHRKGVLIDYFVRTTYATKQPNHARTQPPTASRLAIHVPRIYVLNPSTGVNSPAVPPSIHG